jgi:predicted TIM-barrel fold metal-dependent hydrolase
MSNSGSAVIDFRIMPPLPKVMESYISAPDHHAGYSAVYSYEKTDVGDFAEDLVGTALEGVATRSEMLRRLASGGSDLLLQMLDASGIDMAVCPATDSSVFHGRKTPNEDVARLQADSKGRIFGIGAVDPNRTMEAALEAQYCIKELGLVGINLTPFEHRMFADDRRYYPIYAKCCELGAFVVVHSSVNFSRGDINEYGHPRHLDVVASDFPDLRIVANHAGWPWLMDMVAVAWRHPNIYISPAGQRFRYFAKPGSGWEPLLNYGNGLLKDRVLYGTTWPLLPLRRTVREVNELPLAADVKSKWLGGNALKLLKRG